MDLTEEQGNIVIEYLLADPKRGDRRGRPLKDLRLSLDSLLRVLRTGAKILLHDMALFQQWTGASSAGSRSGRCHSILVGLAEDFRSRGKLDIREAFLDGTFSAAQKGGSRFGKTKRGKGTKFMAVADGNGLPFALHAETASLLLK